MILSLDRFRLGRCQATVITALSPMLDWETGLGLRLPTIGGNDRRSILREWKGGIWRSYLRVPETAGFGSLSGRWSVGDILRWPSRSIVSMRCIGIGDVIENGWRWECLPWLGVSIPTARHGSNLPKDLFQIKCSSRNHSFSGRL